jgi:hypothetical protein
MADGRVCVSDLGAARAVEEDTVTLLGEHLGSLIYASARQARDPHAADFTDDVFSLGQVAYQLFTGLRPIGNPPRLELIRPDLPAEVVGVVERLRHADSRRRPQDADGLADLIALRQPGSLFAIAVGLARERRFDEAVDVVKRLVRFDHQVPTERDAAKEVCHDLVVAHNDPPMEWRATRWLHTRYPDRLSEQWLRRAEQAWQSRVLGDADPALHLTIPAFVAAMNSVREDFDHVIRAAHRTALWMQAPLEGGMTPMPQGLSMFGHPRIRSAFIVGEALLTLRASDLRDSEVETLLPSCWLRDFDDVDESLLALYAEEYADEDAAWHNALREFADGRRLERLWHDWMETACRCRFVDIDDSQGHLRPRGEVSQACPFTKLEHALKDLYDAYEWVRLWLTYPDLAKVEYFANAAITARSMIRDQVDRPAEGSRDHVSGAP